MLLELAVLFVDVLSVKPFILNVSCVFPNVLYCHFAIVLSSGIGNGSTLHPIKEEGA